MIRSLMNADVEERRQQELKQQERRKLPWALALMVFWFAPPVATYTPLLPASADYGLLFWTLLVAYYMAINAVFLVLYWRYILPRRPRRIR